MQTIVYLKHLDSTSFCFVTRAKKTNIWQNVFQAVEHRYRKWYKLLRAVKQSVASPAAKCSHVPPYKTLLDYKYLLGRYRNVYWIILLCVHMCVPLKDVSMLCIYLKVWTSKCLWAWDSDTLVAHICASFIGPSGCPTVSSSGVMHI